MRYWVQRCSGSRRWCWSALRWSLLSAWVLYWLLGFSYFPQTDAGQFVINLKAPSGTKLLVTEQEVAKAEAIIKQVVRPADLGIIVDNIGVDNGFSAIYTPNAAMHTGFIQVGLTPGHERWQLCVYRAHQAAPGRGNAGADSLYFSTGSLVDAVVNMGAPAPDRHPDQRSRSASRRTRWPSRLRATLRSSSAAADVFIPQDLDYPSLRINVDRLHAAKLGLTEKEVLSNVITSLTSNQMIAPNVWIDPQKRKQLLPHRAVPRSTDSHACRIWRRFLCMPRAQRNRPGWIW